MKRNTHQKQTVLNVLESMRGEHPTAETVYERVLQIIPTISRATVYRILSQYADQGTIAQLHIRESADRYDDLLEPHYHLLCTSCKRVLDLEAPRYEKIPLPQYDDSGCKITGVELTFLGICPDCGGRQ